MTQEEVNARFNAEILRTLREKAPKPVVDPVLEMLRQIAERLLVIEEKIGK